MRSRQGSAAWRKPLINAVLMRCSGSARSAELRGQTLCGRARRPCAAIQSRNAAAANALLRAKELACLFWSYRPTDELFLLPALDPLPFGSESWRRRTLCHVEPPCGSFAWVLRPLRKFLNKTNSMRNCAGRWTRLAASCSASLTIATPQATLELMCVPSIDIRFAASRVPSCIPGSHADIAQQGRVRKAAAVYARL